MIVRAEEPEDFEAIDEVNRLAFGQPDEAEIVASLRSSDAYLRGLSLVAEDAGSIIGHIMFTRLQLDPPTETRVISLAPMSVLPARQREGVGSALVHHGLDVARGMGEDLVVVVGHPLYYPRFGFEPASRFGLTCPFPVPDDAFMALRLRDDRAPTGGRVIYPPELGGS